MQCGSYILLFTLWLAEVIAIPLHPREVTVGSITVQQGLHQVVALAAMSLLFTAHRSVMNTGFTLSRRLLTTDTLIGLGLTLLSMVWTSIVILSGFVVADKPCFQGTSQCLARMAFCLWLLQVICLIWLVSCLDAFHYEEVRRFV